MESENFFNNAKISQETKEEIQTPDMARIFENIKTPQELLEFMKNIEYGFVGKNNQKIYSWKYEEMGRDFDKEYFLQSPEELIKSGHGVCWDSAELERYWFEKNGYDFKVFFMIFFKEHNNNLPTHTFLAYKGKDKWFWFEHSFGSHRGVHEYDSMEDLILDVKKKHFDYAIKHRGATVEDEKDLQTFEFEKPRYGSNTQEFIEQAVSGKLVTLEN